MAEWRGPKDQMHKLTAADRKKGRETMTERKKRSLVLNPLKTGKYAKSPYVPDEFLNCDSCKHRLACAGYRQGQDCRVQGVEPLKQLARLYGVDAIELLKTLNKEIVSYALRAKSTDSLPDQLSWCRLLMEFYRLRFGSKEMVLQQKITQEHIVVTYQKPDWLRKEKKGEEND
jgi:hypothetical protein